MVVYNCHEKVIKDFVIISLKSIKNKLGKCSKKILVEFPLRWVGGVSSGPIFHYFFFEKNTSLNTLKLPENYFKTNLFFFQFLVVGPSYDSRHMGG